MYGLSHNHPHGIEASSMTSSMTNNTNQSLSSSNTDSMDTVIYRNPGAMGYMNMNTNVRQFNNNTSSSNHFEIEYRHSHPNQNPGVNNSLSSQPQYGLLPHSHSHQQTQLQHQQLSVVPAKPILKNSPKSSPQGQIQAPIKRVHNNTAMNIKDMISNRFGGGHPEGVVMDQQNCANSYIDLTMKVPSSFTKGETQAQVYTTSAAQDYAAHVAYKSPNMSDRKNVNTSFRKAIQQSTLKSNLSEDSVAKLAPSSRAYNQYQLDQGQERAQKALDQLMLQSQGQQGQRDPSPHQSYPRYSYQLSQSAVGLPPPHHQDSSTYGSSSTSWWGQNQAQVPQETPPPPQPSSSPPSSALADEARENGDGSSATMDPPSNPTNSLDNEQSNSTSQITKELKNFALSSEPANDSEWIDIVETEGVVAVANAMAAAANRSKGSSSKGPDLLPASNKWRSAELSPPENSGKAGFLQSAKMGGSVDLLQSPKSPKVKPPHHTVMMDETTKSPKGRSTASGLYGSSNKAQIQRTNSGSRAQPKSNEQQPPELLPRNPRSAVMEKKIAAAAAAGGGSSRNKGGPPPGGRMPRNAMSKLGLLLNSLQDESGNGPGGGLDFDESLLDGPTEDDDDRGRTSHDEDDDDDDLSTTIDTKDAHAIRRQLESLESMYTEVLKVLGEKKGGGRAGGGGGGYRYPPNSMDLRAAKRRPYGSMSSLPSSVSSRPFRGGHSGDRGRRGEEKRNKGKDLKSISRRFNRLESHVVTLARSVAHLSSEMRTQQLMVQEMDSIRTELAQLRNQVMMKTANNAQDNNNGRRHQQPYHHYNNHPTQHHYPANNNNTYHPSEWSCFRNALLNNPYRVRKLTKFFGDEPPLIRMFLKKLGYERYAHAFETERVGIMEVPYLTEERLNKMGIPMGPRLRILQEAKICFKKTDDRRHHQEGEDVVGDEVEAAAAAAAFYSNHAGQGNNGLGEHGGNLNVYVV